MIKKLIQAFSLILAFTMIISFSACSKSRNAAVIVDDTPVDSGIFAYYLDQVLHGDGNKLSEKDAIKKAQDLTATYVKVNTEFKTQGLRVSSDEKSNIVTIVNDLWSMFGGYYEKIGVSKQTLTKLMESETYKKSLIMSMYGENGEKSISEEDQKKYFDDSNVFFKAISAYLYNTTEDKDVKLSPDEVNALVEKFNEMKKSISSENTIDAVNKSYAESTGGSAEEEMPVLSTYKGSDFYPKGFFTKVSGMEKDEIEVFQLEDYLFLVQRKDSEEYFKEFKSENLMQMASKDFNEEITKRYKKKEVKGNKGLQKDIYDLIIEVRKEK